MTVFLFGERFPCSRTNPVVCVSFHVARVQKLWLELTSHLFGFVSNLGEPMVSTSLPPTFFSATRRVKPDRPKGHSHGRL